MSWGCAPVVFDLGGLEKEFIKQGENGIIIPQGDCSAMSKSIALLQKDANKRKAMAAEALKIVGEFEMNHICERWTQALQLI